MWGVRRAGGPVFRYGVVSDTHCRPELGDESSPWEVNKLANDRARWVVDRFNSAGVDFVIHMGDVVHPLPHLSSYSSAAEAALGIMGGCRAPVYFLPGNHDVGDKYNPAMPAYLVDQHGLDQYSEWFGPLFQSFDHGGVHFVLINSPVLNSGLPPEVEQSRWLEGDLEARRGGRIHVFSHYPLYVLEPREPSNYDNVDEPARSWLLGLLERYQVEAFFAGHVHQFIYQRHSATDCYNLFATSFVRQDYSEMFRIGAGEDYGRNDGGKLGWCIVDVYEDGHTARVLRSGGSTRQVGKVVPLEPRRISESRMKGFPVARVGVHLRHPWSEVVDLPYNGPIDEFARKRVRNDYPLLGLWESGIRDVRVPIRDLMEGRVRDRMMVFRETGIRFHVFSTGLTKGRELKAVKTYHGALESLEVVLPQGEVGGSIDDLIRLKELVPIPLFLAKVISSADRRSEGSKFSHYMSYGFHRDHTRGIDAFLELDGAAGAVDGLVFRLGTDDPPWDSIPAIGEYVATKGVRAIANVRLASENPAEPLLDEGWVANRAAEALVAASATPGVWVFLDTFVDLDRGYFPRVGLYDRRYNRRLGSYVMANLQGALRVYGPAIKLHGCWDGVGGRVCTFESEDAVYNLVLPLPERSYRVEVVDPGGVEFGEEGDAVLVDLSSGILSDLAWERTGRGLSLSVPVSCDVPSLFVLERRG